jgi:hypothetical protein
MDDRDYRQLEKIVKTERRAPLVSNNNRSDIVLQNANVFISIYIPFYLGKCSYTIVADASPHLDTEFVVRSNFLFLADHSIDLQ